MVTEYLKPTVETTVGKKIPFKTLLFIVNAAGHPGALLEIDNEINAVFILVNTTFKEY